MPPQNRHCRGRPVNRAALRRTLSRANTSTHLLGPGAHQAKKPTILRDAESTHRTRAHTRAHTCTLTHARTHARTHAHTCANERTSAEQSTNMRTTTTTCRQVERGTVLVSGTYLYYPSCKSDAERKNVDSGAAQHVEYQHRGKLVLFLDARLPNMRSTSCGRSCSLT